MGQLVVVWPYNTMLHSNRNKGFMTTLNNMDEHQNLENSKTQRSKYYITLSALSSRKTKTSFCFRRRQWHPTPVLLPGKSRGRRCLVGCSSWGRQSRTRLSDLTFTFHFHALEKEMATHSSDLARKIPGTWKPGGLPSMGSHRVGHD